MQAEALMAQKSEEILSNLWKLNVMDIEKTVEKVATHVLQVSSTLQYTALHCSAMQCRRCRQCRCAAGEQCAEFWQWQRGLLSPPAEHASQPGSQPSSPAEPPAKSALPAALPAGARAEPCPA